MKTNDDPEFLTACQEMAPPWFHDETSGPRRAASAGAAATATMTAADTKVRRNRDVLDMRRAPLHACGREPVGLGLRLPCSMASPRGAVRAALPVLPLLPRLTMWSSPAGFSDGRGPAGLCPVAVQRRSSTGCHCSDTRRSLSNSRTGSINMTRCPVGVVLRLRRIG